MIALALLAAAAACVDVRTQTAMTQCAGETFEEADRALNRQWAATLALMRARDADHDRTHDKRAGHAAALLSAQRSWLRFRDAHCQVAGFAMRGGTAEPMLIYQCKGQLTDERTAQLKALVDDFR